MSALGPRAAAPVTETRIVSVGATRAPRRGETIRRGGAGAAVVVGALATAAGLVLACALVDEWLDPQALIASANNNNRDERRTSALGARPGHLLAADVAQLGRLGLKPGYDLLYDFGCIHGLADAARAGAVAGLTQLAAPGATLLITAFKGGRRIALPRGMNQQEVVALLGDRWDLEESRSVATEGMPAFLRRANPTVYRLTRHPGNLA